MTELEGITWDHSRGYLPLVATAQRFSERHSSVRIRWEKRSLQQFADWPIERLAERYDLLVVDHPFCGCAAGNGVLLPLDEHLSAAFLAEQATNSVGASHQSYRYGGHHWALAIDTATPVCGFRRDLLERSGAEPPSTWSEMLELATAGLVVLPALPIDSLMHFYMACTGLREDPFPSEAEVVSRDTGLRALLMLRELVGLCDRECLGRNPIATWELLAESDSVALCPFGYGYSNYARPGYGDHVLEFGPLVRIENGAPCRSTLGGAGLAISVHCTEIRNALLYCQYVASPECQRTLYFDSGGQPGHRLAWLDEEVNRHSGNFFRNTLETLDRAYLRPRYNGYLHFQDQAGEVVHAFLRGAAGPAETLADLNSWYVKSLRQELA